MPNGLASDCQRKRSGNTPHRVTMSGNIRGEMAFVPVYVTLVKQAVQLLSKLTRKDVHPAVATICAETSGNGPKANVAMVVRVSALSAADRILFPKVQHGM